MGGVSDRGEDIVYTNSPSYPEYGYVPPPPPPPAPAPAPAPVAPPPAGPSPAAPSHAIPPVLQQYWDNMQKKAQEAAVQPIPWGLDPTDARNMIHYQGDAAMAGIPNQGPSPQFSAGYDELMKKAYPS
jgi:hypothetical protein